MSRHYVLLSVTGISEDRFKEFLGEFLNNMNINTDDNFGATVLGVDERTGKKMVEDLEGF